MIDHFMMLTAIIQFCSRYFIVLSRHIYLPKTTIELKNQHFVPQSYIWGLQSIEIGNMTMVHSVAFWVVLWFQVCSLPTFTVVLYRTCTKRGFEWIEFLHGYLPLWLYEHLLVSTTILLMKMTTIHGYACTWVKTQMVAHPSGNHFHHLNFS